MIGVVMGGAGGLGLSNSGSSSSGSVYSSPLLILI